MHACICHPVGCSAHHQGTLSSQKNVTDPITKEEFILRFALLRVIADYRALPKILEMTQ
jgi:hypothetical protein